MEPLGRPETGRAGERVDVGRQWQPCPCNIHSDCVCVLEPTQGESCCVSSYNLLPKEPAAKKSCWETTLLYCPDLKVIRGVPLQPGPGIPFQELGLIGHLPGGSMPSPWWEGASARDSSHPECSGIAWAA
ncbi:hypothetical protein P7K49_002186 [Saguinus oedipus]|uniref:Uncharacterized protein n=1 Tax=Saguinus oedipus TaxID=9490 RepID=A0ABQ9WGK9_SAGOE|nr:hypothetical protein P7K49_002186 [Saguinus oedipus]